jgi:hypothetical protein
MRTNGILWNIERNITGKSYYEDEKPIACGIHDGQQRKSKDSQRIEPVRISADADNETIN